MFKIDECIWVGNSKDEEKSVKHVRAGLFDRVLVTAHDMYPVNGWRDRVEYMHVGLVDGPGNPLAAYHAAVLAMVALVRKGKVLVCCHDGGRSLAVVVMYSYLVGNGPSWDECLNRLTVKYPDLPKVQNAHKRAFSLMDWRMLSRVLDSEVSD